jgi:hypothetical protein
LDALGKAPGTHDDLLVCILLDRLPSDVRKNVARHHDQDEWTLDKLRVALRGENRVLEAGQATVIPQHKQQQSTSANQYPRGRQSTNLFSGTSKSFKRLLCVFCGEEHAVSQCQQVTSIEKRKKVVASKKLCSNNCFSPKYQNQKCQLLSSCRVCGSRHHTSLHLGTGNTNTTTLTSATTVSGFHCQTTVLNSSVCDIIKMAICPPENGHF